MFAEVEYQEARACEGDQHKVNSISRDGISRTLAPILSLRQLRRAFGDLAVLEDLDLQVNAGELFTLLGPSGCGKTTTLRLVAGLDQPEAGEIWFEGRLICGSRPHVSVPPHRRNMGMVFQSYAVWPHMGVFENVAYPLRARGVPREEIKRRVTQTLRLAGLSGLEDRPGSALSGGQQQRVAIARALVYEPKLLLLDEPFSNLDAKLREQMRSELKKLLKGLGITVLLVTHDQLEAFGMSDRIAVMNHGRIEQIGSAFELYDNPASAFVRDFLGRVVLLRGSIAAVSGGERLTVVLDESCQGSSAFQIGQSASNFNPKQQVVVAIRPERICVRPAQSGNGVASDGENVLSGTIETLMFAGDRLEVRLRAGTAGFTCYLPRIESWHEGQAVQLSFPAEDLSIWPAH